MTIPNNLEGSNKTQSGITFRINEDGSITRIGDFVVSPKLANKANDADNIEVELKLWTYAEKENTIRSYNLYLKKYPDGKHKDEANRRIKSMAERLGRRKRVRLAVVSVLSCSLLILFLVIGYRFLPNKADRNLKTPNELDQLFEVSELERRTEKVIAAMEATKRLGYAVDTDSKKKAEELLFELKEMNSIKYNELNRRYNNL